MGFSKLYAIPAFSLTLVLLSFMVFDFDFAWLWIFPIVGIVFLVTSWIIPFYWLRRVPQAARILEEAARTKQVPAYIVHDSGRGAFVLLEERRGEGLVVAKAGSGRRRYRLLPRIVDVEEGDVKEEARKKLKGNSNKNKLKLLLDYASDWINKRSICVGLGLPIYLGYSGTLCLLNPECLAWYEAGKIFLPTERNPQPTSDKEKQLPWPLMLLSALEMNNIINRRFNTTQTDALEIDATILGRLGRGTPGWIFGVGIVLIVIVAIILLLFFQPFG